jgi:hypothetical protein
MFVLLTLVCLMDPALFGSPETPLQNSWTWWYDAASISKNKDLDFRKHLKEVARGIQTVEQFWDVFNHVMLPSHV